VVSLSLAVAGTYAFTPPFWALASSFMSGAAAAGGIAAMSAVGILGGFFAPSIMGYMKDLTGSFSSGQVVIAGMAFGGAALIVVIGRWRSDILAPHQSDLVMPAAPSAGAQRREQPV
jgi:ACS family tartrate transporter-like MFS transporter